MTDLLANVLLPVAHPDDAAASCRALTRHHEGGEITAVHVVEKADGAPDKASVEQREDVAEDAFDVVREAFPDAETDVVYATSVVEGIFWAADEHDASAIVFTPRPGGRLARFLSGDVAQKLIEGSDRPVVVLPDPGVE